MRTARLISRIISGAAAAALCLLACGPRLAAYEETRFVMGTAATVKALAPEEATARRAVAAAFASLAESERIAAYNREGNELARVNRAAAEAPVAVSAELFGLLERALAVAAATDGYFDPTIAPVIDLYGIKNGNPRWPADEDITAARALVGYRGVVLDRRARTVAFARKGMKLDLSGVAAGWAVDRAVGAAAKAGAVAVLVDGGGEVSCFGGERAGRPWRVGIRHPRAAGLYGRIEIAAGAAATAGDYEQAFEVGGRRFSHLFDPFTGRPAAGAAGVTVFLPAATDNAVADGWSTALAVMPPAAADKVLKRPGAPAALILREVGGDLRPRVSPGFPALKR